MAEKPEYLQNMTVDKFIQRFAIKERIADASEIAYTDQELIAYINDAINMVWQVMIQKDYDEAAGWLTMDSKEEYIPKDYGTPTGAPPVYRDGDKVVCYGDLPCTFRYWKQPPRVGELSDELPPNSPFMKPAIVNLLAQIVISLAMQNHGFDMGSEMDFATSIGKMLPT